MEILLAAVFLIGGFVIYARFLEPLWVGTSRYSLDFDDLPTAKLTILHLSDLHLKEQDRFQQLKLLRIEEQIRALDREFDLILLTGDLIENNSGISVVGELIDRLPRPRLGFFACPGNHDYFEYGIGPSIFARKDPARSLIANAWTNFWEIFWAVLRNKPLRLGWRVNDFAALQESLVSRGVKLLINEAYSVEAQGGEIWLAGIDDLSDGSPDCKKAVKSIPPGAFSMILAHNPDSFRDLELQRWSLGFSGHVHGGQVVLPFLGAWYRQGAHLPRQKSAGLFEYGRTKVIISRGAGESTPLRFNCRPEIICMEAHKNAGKDRPEADQ